ncbi:MAG: hypothetical protein V3W14_13430 [Candidatus Neomarinimicrobiota bacterium]
MALFRGSLTGALLLVTAMLTGLWAQTPRPKSDFNDLGAKGAVAAVPASLPLTSFGPLSATLFPMMYRPEGKGSDNPELLVLPIVEMQWWLSPNLAIHGGFGSGRFAEQLPSVRRLGFRYLPEFLAFKSGTPEFALAQGRIDGLAAYTLKWNEVLWNYTYNWGAVDISGGLAWLYITVFPDEAHRADVVSGRLEVTTRAYTLAASWRVWRSYRLGGRLILNPEMVSAGAQLSLAI